jgi:mannose-6-phosphate isomerase
LSTKSEQHLPPLRLTPTRVSRFYRGGALIDRLRGCADEEDGRFPEDWIGSVTPAANGGRDDPEAGLTRLVDGSLLRDRIAANPLGWLGKPHVERFGATTGLLVKLLDTAERLPVHFHPARPFAAAHLGSPFGKTEAWIVLCTRGPSAHVWVGLRDPVDPATYREWIESQNAQALLASLQEVEIRAGDVIYVPAGAPHAIGGGALIAELQEPTDFSIVCEWDRFSVPREQAHLGLGWDTALGALDLCARATVGRLPEAARAFFWADELPTADGRFAVLIVLEGEGTVSDQPVGPGDAFAVPAAIGELHVTGDLRVLRCLGPETGSR